MPLVPIHAIKIVMESRWGHMEPAIDILVESLRDRGQQSPLYVQRGPTGVYELLDGYHRLIAMRRLGWEEAEVVLVRTQSPSPWRQRGVYPAMDSLVPHSLGID